MDRCLLDDVPATARHDRVHRRVPGASLRDPSTAGRVAGSVDGSVQGVFTQDAQLRGLFPGYLAELRHTAFVGDDEERLAERARTVRDDPVGRYVTKAPRLDVGDSHTHAAELFLHSGLAALPVLDAGRFVGMLDQRALCEVADDLLVG